MTGHRGFKRKNKYSAVKCEANGFVFDSKAEMKRYFDLKRLEKAGEISDLMVHPSYPIQWLDHAQRFIQPRITSQRSKTGRKVAYKADFSYRDNTTGQLVVEDVKGVSTPVFKLKRALVEAIYDIEITIVPA